MVNVYSTYEAKARFTELLRKVRSGQTVRITYRGEEVAEIRPLVPAKSLEQRLAKLEEEGILSGASRPPGALTPIVRRPGALKRFLESRD